eukprot:TRINITY_DN5918_c0_g1_i1.p1 TRINITY_DN5918_c0_g1~~TRINITY_DN5918_c0_g1_i1.p1  ORF type:complete len:144 (-),score=11.24 TRINITY_DN5918_c0_g1_i1:377-808(-)
MAGLTRKSSGYNPLDTAGQAASLDDTWVCVAAGAAFRVAPSISAATKAQFLQISTDAHPSDGGMYETVPVDTELVGKREGDWIQVLETDVYVPVKDPETGIRYFKNKRLHIWESGTSEGDSPKRRPSQASVKATKSHQRCALM